jgi:hypothetical protein
MAVDRADHAGEDGSEQLSLYDLCIGILTVISPGVSECMSLS